MADTEVTNAPLSGAVAPVAAEGTAEKGVKKGVVRARKKKAVRTVPIGRVYVQATYNNTIITMTDPHGNVLGWSSSGKMGFTGPKKATPYAASITVKDVCDKLKDVGLREVAVFVKGIGSGREGAIRALNANGLTVTAIKDVTPIPHNGCRPPGVRRI
ncbi:MAG: 30S ribosomal protein S11 [Patescibacteria group bacterium]